MVHSWKSYTSTKANEILSREGRFWQADYYDRYVRNEKHLANVIEYIHYNPVEAGLVEKMEDWPFSSATSYI